MIICAKSLLTRLQEYVAEAKSLDPFSDEALFGDHMVEICQALITSPETTGSDVMTQQMIAWARHRDLL